MEGNKHEVAVSEDKEDVKTPRLDFEHVPKANITPGAQHLHEITTTTTTTVEKTREERLEMFMTTFKNRKQLEDMDKEEKDEEDETGIHALTFRDMASHMLDVYETGGFDVQDYSHVNDACVIRAYYDPDANITGNAEYLPELTDCAHQAILQYNGNTAKNFDVMHVIKANVEVACPLRYYIRFKARDETQGITETFEAIVNVGIPTTEREVTLVRIRQPPRLFSL